MYRRIEIIDRGKKYTPFGIFAFWVEPEKLGAFFKHFDLIQATPAPKRRKIGRRPRFYFTEEGWKKIGKDLAESCRKMELGDVRILKVKERSVDVQYKDWCQVAVRPRRKRRA